MPYNRFRLKSGASWHSYVDMEKGDGEKEANEIREML